MLVAIFGDSHHGKSNDSPVYQNALSRFYREVFFPVIDNCKVQRIIHTGDVFDKRKSINTLTLDLFNREFMDEISMRIESTHSLEGMDIVIGNHDCYYNNTNEVNSVEGVLRNVPKAIRIHTGPSVQKFGTKKVMFVPWINPDNATDTVEFMKTMEADYCVGHLEVDGAYNGRGRPHQGGFNRSFFKRFKRTFSGHIHAHSDEGGVMYVGSPVDQDWGEACLPHGFVLFDTSTEKIEYITNPHMIYRVIEYTGVEKAPKDVENQIVRVVVVERGATKKYTKFMEDLAVVNPAEIEVMEKETLTLVENHEADIKEAQLTDTRDILIRFVDENVEGEKKELDLLKDILTSSYDEVTK